MYSVVFITGASSGIGKALAFAYAEKGYRIAILARRQDRLIAIQKSIEEKYPVQVLPLVADVCDEEAVSNAVQKTLDIFGKIDVVIANAGSGVKGKVEDLNPSDFKRQFDINIMGVLNTVHATLEPLKKSHGKLALMGSICSFIALPTSAPYSMSKYAVRALSESLRYELRPCRVSVTLICPGFVASEFRQVDNQGKYKNGTKEPIPAWLLGDVKKAASAMFLAVHRKKKVMFFTFHARLLYMIKMYVPPLFDLIAMAFPRLRSQREKKS